MFRFLLLISSLLFVLGCDDDDNGNPPGIMAVGNGVNFSTTTTDSETAYNTLIANLEANANIGIVAQVNHGQNAAANNFQLRDTRVVLFGNPALGTPLMQENQQAGLDLPQKIAVYRAENGETVLVYNSTDYLVARHGLTASTLPQISNTLASLVTNASGGVVPLLGGVEVDNGEGILTQVSTQSFEDSYNDLIDAIEANSNLILVAELDHQENAQSVGLDLRPTRLVVFGNPNLGTPLMQSDQGISLDLPQKMLIYENGDGEVIIAYNNPNFLAERFNIDDQADNTSMIALALSTLANAAAGI